MIIGALLHNAIDGRLHPVQLGPSPAPEGSPTVPGRERYAIVGYDRQGHDVYVDAFRKVYEACSPNERTFINTTFRWDGETPPALVAWFDLEDDHLRFTIESSEGILSEPPSDDWKRNLALMPYDRALRLKLEEAVAGQEPFEDETARHVAMAHHAIEEGLISAGLVARRTGIHLDDLAALCVLYGHEKPFDY